MIDIISFSTNKTLYKHSLLISQNLENCNLFGNVRKNKIDLLLDLFKPLGNEINGNKILVYNTSPKNLIVSLFLKIKRKSILFHLHDPVPHSGVLNPVLYLLNFFQVLISNHILVFDDSLISKTKKFYPFVLKKNIIVIQHGYPKFNYIRQLQKSDKVRIGFFGRYMPYKGFNSFLEFVKKNYSYSYYVVGHGYDRFIDKLKQNNISYINKYVHHDAYYSLMREMDYLYVSYKDISFSGVINDAIYLGKGIIVSNKVSLTYKDKYFIPISDNLKLKKLEDSNTFNTNKNGNGWEEYTSILMKI